MDGEQQRRDFRTIAVALGSDPDLALARAQQLGGQQVDLAPADVYLLVLRELCEGRV